MHFFASKQQWQDQNSDHPCSYCGKKGHGKNTSAQKRETNFPAFDHLCRHCNRLHHFEHRSKDNPRISKNNKDKAGHQGPIYNTLCSACTNGRTADHHIYQKSTKQWKQRPSSPQAFIDMSVRIEDQDYADLEFCPIANNPGTTITISAMADTGC